jgi:hypothetical protein
MLVVWVSFNKSDYRNREPKLRENIYCSRKPAQADLRDKSHHHQLQRGNVRSLQTLRALLGFEANLLVFGERLEAVATNFRKVGEEIVAACVRRNEAEALAVIEPLNDTGIHIKSLKI